ncbi:MAG: efflux RND transporter permease subunit [Myxococcales bacterium]|nr:efflux RND transporter permease subunit [Myxococcales bacterium]
MKSLFRVLLRNRLVVLLLTVVAVGWGVAVAPFGWQVGGVETARVPVDAIPDIGENQQIVFTKWAGRSPQDVEDQLTYPLTVALLGIPGVRTIRSNSMFGFSSVNVIFEDDVEFYWSRSRLLEKLASLPPGTLPGDVKPQLGPDATALGQVYWYTLEGRSPDGKPTPGWSLEELRSLQDFYVKPALNAAKGISEVATTGGMLREYQIDVDPDAMRAYGVKLGEVVRAIKRSNRDVGARTIEVNRIEYVMRGIGFVRGVSDLEKVVIRARDGVPVRVKDVAKVHTGPAMRRGMLDKGGADVVGGVAVVRYGANPMESIAALKAKVTELSRGLPSKTLADGTVSKVTVVPFYDRTQLIQETIGTLEDALFDEVLIAALVVLVMLLHLRASVLISGLLPIAVLLAFVAMKALHVDANVVALSGIAIAIGTMVDMGIVVTENIVSHIERYPDKLRLTVIRDATAEVAGAVLTAVATTVASFLPVFGLQAAEGKLFTPLAWTKTFSLVMAVVVALTVLPAVAVLLFPQAPGWLKDKWAAFIARLPWAPTVAPSAVVPTPTDAPTDAQSDAPSEASVGASTALARGKQIAKVTLNLAVALVCAWYLARHWMPLGKGEPVMDNFVFVVLVTGSLLGLFWLFQAFYSQLLQAFLARKLAFIAVPLFVLMLGLSVWLGADRVFGWLPDKATAGVRARFPGLSEEFMPKLDEGSYLWMPTIMPHGGISAGTEIIAQMDRAISAIPEVKSAVGKLGRAESALDPAPLSMIETIVTLKPEFTTLADGTRKRNWRPKMKRQSDIWAEITRVAQVPGATSAPELQPIAGRIVMLATGMRAPMGIKVKGPDLKTLGDFALKLEALVKAVPEVQPAAVLADRVIGKPYLEIQIDREAIARYGARIEDVQQVIEVAIGGMPITMTVEGRERYPVRVRYPREQRDNLEALGGIIVPTPSGAQLPLRLMAKVAYSRGPQAIKSEDTFLTAYVVFDGQKGQSEIDVVNAVRAAVDKAVADKTLKVPQGVSWRFAGNYESKLRSDARLKILIPLALVLVFILLYLQFRSVATTAMVFTGVAVAMGGGFLALWAWGEPWFLDASVLGHNLRDIFGVRQINLSVAVWVGFIALIGIATDDGVVMATYLDQSFAKHRPRTREAIRAAVVEAGSRRIRPCLMTTATTVLALLPILTSTGRGSDVMIPMSIPAFGGMALELITLFVVPVLYCGWQELKLAVGAVPSDPEQRQEQGVQA